MTCALNAADICVPQPAGGPGANGPYGMIADTVRTGDDARDRVFVFLPDTSAGKAPILFFCHRVGATDPREYGPFIRHLVSRGSAVVYPVCGSGVGPL